MKKSYTITATLVATGMLATLAFAAGKSSIELGQKLFNDPKLGGATGSKSCNSCHADGKGLEKAGSDPKKLSKIINNCLTSQLQGKKLDGRSLEMKSLKMYIGSLAKKSGQAAPPPKASTPK